MPISVLSTEPALQITVQGPRSFSGRWVELSWLVLKVPGAAKFPDFRSEYLGCAVYLLNCGEPA
jgi:hypothetical protein